MARSKGIASILLGVAVVLAAAAAAYCLVPTAPRSIEGEWVSDDGSAVYVFERGLARQYLADTYGTNAAPDQTFRYIVAGNTVTVSDGKEANGADVLLPPYTAETRYALGNRLVTLYDADVRMNAFYRLGSPEAALLHLGTNWYK